MQYRLLILGLLLVCLTTLTTARAETTVSAQVDRTTLSSGQSVHMQVKVSGGSGKVDISPIDDFKVHSRGSSSSVHIINGRMSKEVSYNYLLLPKRKGQLTIPPLTVTVDGKDHRTKPIDVTVADRAATGNSDPNRAREIWVTADISEISPYAGQQFTYTFRFYRAVPIQGIKFQAPEFTGFSTQAVEDERSYRKVINGLEHVVTEVYYILTPLKQGRFTIDPAVVQVGVVRRDRRRSRSPFDDFFNRGVVEPRMLETQPLEISVRPLPPLPPGREFSGLVGQFTMATELESNELQVGDSVTLATTIEGKGNIMDLQSPHLKLPDAFKAYTDNPEEKTRTDRNGSSGKKVFRTALVPIQPGEFMLPPVELVYFDVAAEEYRILQNKVPAIRVVTADKAQGGPLAITPGPLPQFKKKVAFTGRDILPPKESLSAIQSSAGVTWPIFLFSIAGPAMIFGLVVLAQRLKRPDTSAGALMKAKARQALKDAAASTGDEFITKLYRAVTAAIFAAAGRTGEALTWKEAKALLLSKNFSEEDAADAAKLLSQIESSKFSGAALDEGQTRELLDRTRKTARKLIP